MNMYSELGDWVIESGEVLGEGTFGEVRQAVSKKDTNRVAVAKIFSAADSIPEFQNEVFALQVLKGVEGIPKIYDFGLVDDRPVIIMEKVVGERLHEKIRQDSSLSADEVQTYLVQLLEILRSVHRAGIVHRDIKPGNIIISNGKLFLIDWGSADALGVGRCFWPVGTRAYSAPELFYGFHSVSSDFYSVGWVLAYMAAAQWPFQTKKIQAENYRLAAACLEKPIIDRRILGKWYFIVKALVAKDSKLRPVAYDLEKLAIAAKYVSEDMSSAGREVPPFMSNDYYLGLAADNDVLYAQYLLGWNAMEEGDMDASGYWLRRSAKGGYPRSQYALGYSILRKGLKPEGADEAYFYLNEGSKIGHSLCQFWLGMYWKDKKNYSEMKEWLIKSATAGYSYAQYYLGKFLIERGDSCGWYWMFMAKNRGSGSAKKFLQKH